MSVVTKTGDDGTTWAAGCRVFKSSPVVHLLGDLDELNSWIGHVAAQRYVKLAKGQHVPTLTAIQNTLFEAGACVATKKPFGAEDAQWLEGKIFALEAELAPLHNFILPQYPSELHIARAVCRRVERSAQEHYAEERGGNLMIYLNRLSDYLFVLARWICTVAARRNEKIWKPRK